MALADYIPKRRIVTAITVAQNAVCTAAIHGYTSEDYVRINVPVSYGMRLGSVQSRITVINANTFFLNLSTEKLDAFLVPGVPLTRAEALPISKETDNIAT